MSSWHTEHRRVLIWGLENRVYICALPSFSFKAPPTSEVVIFSGYQRPLFTSREVAIVVVIYRALWTNSSDHVWRYAAPTFDISDCRTCGVLAWESWQSTFDSVPLDLRGNLRLAVCHHTTAERRPRNRPRVEMSKCRAGCEGGRGGGFHFLCLITAMRRKVKDPSAGNFWSV